MAAKWNEMFVPENMIKILLKAASYIKVILRRCKKPSVVDFYLENRTGFIGYSFRAGFFKKSLRGSKISKLIWLDEVKDKIDISDTSCPISICSPIFYGYEQKSHPSYPTKFSFVYLDNVLVNSGASNFIAADYVYVDRVPGVNCEECDYGAAYMYGHNKDYCIINAVPDPVLRVDDAIFFGGNGSSNYYHWLIEITPKIIRARASGLIVNDTNIIVPDEIFYYPQLVELLKLSLLGVSPNILRLSKLNLAFVTRLTYISGENSLVFNSRLNYSATNFCTFGAWSLNAIRQSVLTSRLKYTGGTQKLERIFLVRGNGLARKYNESALVVIAESYGFTPVLMSSLSLCEQAEIFNSGKVIIGPSGAAWANLVFCCAGLKCLTWLPECHKDFSVYSSIGKYFGAEVHAFSVRTKNDGLHDEYHIEADYFETQLRALIEACS